MILNDNVKVPFFFSFNFYLSIARYGRYDFYLFFFFPVFYDGI